MQIERMLRVAQGAVGQLTLKSFLRRMWSLNNNACPAAPGLETVGLGASSASETYGIVQHEKRCAPGARNSIHHIAYNMHNVSRMAANARIAWIGLGPFGIARCSPAKATASSKAITASLYVAMMPNSCPAGQWPGPSPLADYSLFQCLAHSLI